MDTRDSQTFFAHGDDLCRHDVHDSLSLPDARVGPPLTIVMNNPEVPKIHGAHNLQNNLFFLFQYIVVGKGKDKILHRTQPRPCSCALLRRSRDIIGGVYTRRYMEVRQQHSMHRCGNKLP